MANIKSQIKRNRQNNKRRLRNRVYRGTARVAVKSARSAIDSGTLASKEALVNAISTLDKAAEKGVLHKNNAARRKSRLMKAYAKMEVVAVPAVSENEELESEVEEKKTSPAKSRAKAATAPKKTPPKKSSSSSAVKASKSTTSTKKTAKK